MSGYRPGDQLKAVSMEPGDGFFTYDADIRNIDPQGVRLTFIDPAQLSLLLASSAARHSHLCPRQVLGVRVGLAGLAYLGLPAHARDKRVLIICETDGCFLDGLEVATGATPGQRTLRVVDYGKAGATFIDTKTSRAVRIAPRIDSRKSASQYASSITKPSGESETRPWFIQLHAYQIMPDQELLSVQPVQLVTPVEVIISKPGLRAECSACGEEIINERQVEREGSTYCCACAGSSYYQPLSG